MRDKSEWENLGYGDIIRYNSPDQKIDSYFVVSSIDSVNVVHGTIVALDKPTERIYLEDLAQTEGIEIIHKNK